MANMLLICQAWDATCDFHFSDLEITPWRSSNVKSVYDLDVTCNGQSKSKVKMHFSWAEIYFVPYPFFDKIDILVHISQCYTVPSPHDVWRLDLPYLLRKSVFDTVPSSHFWTHFEIYFVPCFQPISIRSLVTCIYPEIHAEFSENCSISSCYFVP